MYETTFTVPVPRCPVPCVGRRARMPGPGWASHLADRNDPHRTRDLLPDVRFGEGAPALCDGDKAKDFYLDVSTARLYVLKRSGAELQWVRVSAVGDPAAVPPAASEAAEAVASAGTDVSDMTDDDKDALLATLARYVIAKEGLS